MKKLLFILIITAVWGNLSAQLKTYKYHDNTAITQTYRGEALSTKIVESKNGDSEIGVIRVEEDRPYDAVEQMPTFPGGEAELMKFIRDNLRYPLTAKKEGIQGRIILRFVVSKTGAIDNITVLRSLDPACDEEAIRLIKSMPRWIPGKQNGNAVPVYFTLPVVFKLSKTYPGDYEYHGNTSMTQVYDRLENRGETISTEIVELKKEDTEPGVIAIEDERPYDAVEQMPTFPGGEAELMKFIRENLKYPLSAQKEGIQGRVILRFVVSKTGSIENITILRSLEPACDEEAIRLIKSMPRWIPGKQNGNAVPVYYTLPVVFKLIR